ncbi:MAG: fumarylacetoacetate hydrolase family protein [Burkholderiales bacterium]|nr:fumarylacetoacetate hydrolase family protein [Burkholderiales bacterium]
MQARIDDAARWLAQRHTQRAGYAPLPGELRPAGVAEAYAVQDALVRHWCADGDRVAGYKIALTTPQMRRMVGFDDSIAGQVLESRVDRSPAAIALAHAVHLGFECEIAFRIGRATDPAAPPGSREAMAQHIDAIAPAFELIDDGGADYRQFADDDGSTLVTLAADNAWNHGVVLGEWRSGWQVIDSDALVGIASIGGREVGRGQGRDVLGHPLDAMLWIAAHLAARGRGLSVGDFVITGSLVTTRFPAPDDEVAFALDGIGAVRMRMV